MADNQQGPSPEQLAYQKELNALYKTGAITLAEFNTLLAESNRLTQGQLKNAAAHVKSLSAATKAKEAQVKAAEKVKQIDTDILNLAGQLTKPLQQIGKLRQIDEKTGKTALKTQLDHLKQKQQEVIAARKSGQLTAAQAKQAMDSLVHMKGMLKSMAVIEDKSPALANGLRMASEQADQLQSNIDSFFGSLPGGDFIKNKLGFDKVGEQVQNGLVAGVGALGDALKNGATPLQALKAGMSAFNAIAALNPVVLIVASLVAAGAAFKTLIGYASEHEEKSRKTAEAMGISVTQAMKMRNEAYAAASAFGNQLVNVEDVLAVQQEVNNELGNAGMLSADIAAKVGDIGASFGYGAQEAGKVQAQLQSMGVSAVDAADSQREIAAEALKAGVNVGNVMKDIAKSSKNTAKFFGGNVKSLAKAAIQAAKLGMSLDDMANIADNLLDFEKSIASQFELQALTGKQMNFDKARQLALEGDIAGASAAVLEQVGSIHDFNKMDVLERKKLAEATGMSVDQLQKSLAIQEALPGATQAQLEAVNQLGLSAAEIQKMGPEELQNRLAQAQAAKKMDQQMANMKAQMKKALLPLGQALLSVFNLLTPVLKVIGMIFKGIGATISFILKPLDTMVKAFNSIYDFISASKEAVVAFGAAFLILLGYQQQSLIIEQGKNALMLLQSGYQGMLAAGQAAYNMVQSQGLMKTIGHAAMTAFRSAAAVPVVGPLLGAAAAAAAVGLGMKYMSGDDVVSKSTGGSGYGSRVLFGPEGAISFNNKDTIVAGTNLGFSARMNDGVIAPKGALKVDDYASDMPDPPEAKIVGMSGGTIAALAAAVNGGALATAMVPKPVLVMNPVLPTFETNPMMMMGSMMGGVTSAFGAIGDLFGFGGDDKADSKPVTMEDVINAISNIEIQLDGKNVAQSIRVSDSFMRR